MILNCPLCQSKIDLLNCPGRNYPCEGEKDKSILPEKIFFCGSCRGGIAHPVPGKEAMEKYYSQGQFWNNRLDSFSVRTHPGQYVLARARWDIVKPLLKDKPISILDIGAGNGFFGMIAMGDGRMEASDYCAVEPDVYFNSALRKTWDKAFPQSRLKIAGSISDVPEKYDLVVLSHILEHIDTPGEFIGSVLSRLKEEGVLFIDVPNEDFVWKKTVFPHLLFFNKESLRNFLESHGLDILRIDVYGRSVDGKNSFYSKCLKVFERVIYKSRKVLPRPVLEAAFAFILKAGARGPRGMWIRAAARKR